MARWPDKDPDAVLDYELNWSAWLNGDSIATSTWDVPSGLTKVSDSFTSTATKIWLSGGSYGQTYAIRNRITTAAGRTDDRTVSLRIRQK